MFNLGLVPIVGDATMKTQNAATVVDVRTLGSVWSAIKAISFGLLTGSPWIEYTPIGEDKKPGKKVMVEGVVDGNKLCKFCKVTRQEDKLEFCKLVNLVLQNPKKYLTPDMKQVVNASISPAKWYEMVAWQLENRKVKCVHYRPTFEWSAKDDKGNTVFGLGEDWNLFHKRWEASGGDEFRVSEEYGKESWGQYIMTPVNVLEIVKKAIEKKMAITPPQERGRGKKASKIQVIIDTGLLDAELAAMLAAQK